MMWPRERSLSEDEYLDAQRAWRNVASDPQAGKRLLIFPEPMEYAAGASTPAEIGIPELAMLNRDNILTAFPISPYQLGVPMPGGLNSGELRREDRRDYWEGTIAPRVALLKETIQTGLVSLYEAATGRTFDFDLAIPNLDDGPALMEKAAAFKGLVSIGHDPKEALAAVGLDHIKWLGLPELLDPAKQAAAAREAAEAQNGDGSRSVVRDDTPRDNTATQQTLVGKAVKTREQVAGRAQFELLDFLEAQRDRVIDRLREALPAQKTKRAEFIKADPDWWEAAAEDAALRSALTTLYLRSANGSLQVVADSLNRIVPNKWVERIAADLAEHGAQRIADINARTLQAITIELAEGTRRGYSVTQLIEGVADEGFRGVKNVGLDNGVAAWGDARAETIARTETALSYNRAALSGYKEFRVQRVVAFDGDKDAECSDRNGREFSIEDAFEIADHPNGTLDWGPVVDVGKSYDQQHFDIAPVINLTLPPTNITNQLPATELKVVNEVQTPTVTVAAPEVKVFNCRRRP
jgi:hypothetical protein